MGIGFLLEQSNHSSENLIICNAVGIIQNFPFGSYQVDSPEIQSLISNLLDLIRTGEEDLAIFG